MIQEFQPKRGDKSKLSYDELALLMNKLIPTAKRWVVEFPALRDHAMSFLDYWGETNTIENGDQK